MLNLRRNREISSEQPPVMGKWRKRIVAGSGIAALKFGVVDNIFDVASARPAEIARNVGLAVVAGTVGAFGLKSFANRTKKLFDTASDHTAAALLVGSGALAFAAGGELLAERKISDHPLIAVAPDTNNYSFLNDDRTDDGGDQPVASGESSNDESTEDVAPQTKAIELPSYFPGFLADGKCREDSIATVEKGGKGGYWSSLRQIYPDEKDLTERELQITLEDIDTSPVVHPDEKLRFVCAKATTEN